MANATLLIRAPQLISPRTVKADAEGNFHVPLLPTGDYTITVTAVGFVPYQNKQTIRIGYGAQVRQNFELKSDTAAATVEIVASSSAVMDKSDSKVSVNYSADTLESLPAVNRTFEGVVDLAPGVVTGPLGSGTATIRGGKGYGAVYNLNGTSVGDEIAGTSPNVGTTFVIDDAVEDTQVILSPLNSKYGRTSAGIINVATKSGGNSFEGSIRKYLSRNDWQGNRPNAAGASEFNDFYDNRKTDIFLAGPIWKDHIWFAFSTIQAPTTSQPYTIQLGTDPSTWGIKKNPLLQTGVTWATGQNPLVPTGSALAVGSAAGFDDNKSYDQSTKSEFYNGKVTWAATPNHTFTVERTYNQSKIQNATYAEFGITASLATNQPDWTANAFNALNYKGVLGSNLFVEASLSQKQYQHSNGPATPFLHVRLYQSVQGGQIWPYGTNINGGVVQNNGDDAGSVNFKWLPDFHGTHEIDFGYQYQESAHQTQGLTGLHNERFYVYGDTTNPTLLAAAGIGAAQADPFGNQVGYLALNWADQTGFTPGASTGIAPLRRYYTSQDGIARSRDEGYYVNDVWSPNSHWTFLGGLREDHIRVADTTGVIISQYWASPSPRFQAKYDLKGDSSDLFTGSIAKYVENVAPAYIENLITYGSSDYQNWGWSANAPKTASWVPYSALVNPANYTKLVSNVKGSALNLNDGIRSPYMVEESLGYRHNRANGSYVGITVVNRDWYNDLAIKQDGNVADLAAYEASKGTAVPTSWAATGVDPTGQTTYGIPRHFFNSSDIHRNFKSVEIEFTEVLTSRFTFGGSFTWSRLTGNDNGGDAVGEPGFSNNANPSALTTVSEYYNFRNALQAQGWTPNQISPYGALVTDQTHKARLHWTYNQPVGKDGKISYALLLRYDSGLNYSAQDGFSGQYNGAGYDVPVFPGHPALNYGAPADYNSSFAPYSSARGAFHQDDTYQFDFTLNVQLPVAAGVKFIAKLNVTNIFNHILVNTYNNYYASDTRTLATDKQSGLPVADPTVFGTPNSVPGYANFANYIYGRTWALSAGIKF